MTKPSIVFLDTNILLHFPPIKEIDWCEVTGAAEVRLVVCMTVIDELDAHKSNARLSDRAERAIREIREAHTTGGQIRRGVQLCIFNKSLSNYAMAESRIPESADERIICFASVYSQEHSTTDIAIATDDIGMALRATSAGVRVISLPETMRLQVPPDELKKKYQQALQELNALKNRLPKLTLGLALSNQVMREAHQVFFEIDDSWVPRDIDAVMETIRRGNWSEADPEYRLARTASDLVAGMVSQDRIRRYNEQLEEYYSDYREYLARQEELEKCKARSFSFELWLRNTGKGIASDIDVSALFPPQVCFLAESGSEEARGLEMQSNPPSLPKFPSLFEHLIPRDLDVPRPALTYLNPLQIARRHDERRLAVKIQKNSDGMYEIHGHIARVKHGDDIRVGRFILTFTEPKHVRSFKAQCSISAEELGDKTSLELPFIVALKSEQR